VCQPCQYGALTCAGCQIAFRQGESMVSHGTALVHQSPACEAAHEAEAARLVRKELESAQAPIEYYGVYSDEIGASGVYSAWEEVERLLQGEHGREMHAVSLVFEFHAEAAEFVRERTRARSRGRRRRGRSSRRRGSRRFCSASGGSAGTSSTTVWRRRAEAGVRARCT
jgi:hypothetical protein